MTRLADFIDGIDGINKRRAWQHYLDELPREVTYGWNALLTSLPAEDWAVLKSTTHAQINLHHPARGWLQAQDRFNEARAYLYLSNIGCRDICFTPVSITERRPDLLARQGDALVACEVKSLRLDATSPHARRKLVMRLEDATEQLDAIAADIRCIYLVTSTSAAILCELLAGQLRQCHLIFDCNGFVTAYD